MRLLLFVEEHKKRLVGVPSVATRLIIFITVVVIIVIIILIIIIVSVISIITNSINIIIVTIIASRDAKNKTLQ